MPEDFRMDEKTRHVLDTIKSRRSIRFYKPDPVPEKAIEEMIEAARWAPSAHNFQPTEFVVIQDDDTRMFFSEIAIGAAKSVYGDLTVEEAKEVTLTLPDHLQDGGNGRQLQRISGEFYKYIYTAPLILLVCVDMGSPYYEADGWMAVQNLLVAAKAMGFGSIATVRGVVRKKDRDSIREKIGVPNNYEILGIVLVGYPDEEPEIVKRDLDELIHYEKFNVRAPSPAAVEVDEEVVKILAARLSGGFLDGWEEDAVNKFARKVAGDNAGKVGKARAEGMDNDDIVDRVLMSKARSAIRDETMEQYGGLIKDTTDEDYMSWKSDKGGKKG